MNDIVLPEVGSRWTVEGVEVEVVRVAKRGRGYQVYFELETGNQQRWRLKDFKKKAGAHVD